MPLRCDRSEEVKAAGFDSQTEGERLGENTMNNWFKAILQIG